MFTPSFEFRSITNMLEVFALMQKLIFDLMLYQQLVYCIVILVFLINPECYNRDSYGLAAMGEK